MSYSKKNLQEVEDQAPGAGMADSQEAHFAHGELGAEETGLSYQVLRPNKRQAFGHRHNQAEEIYVVLSGSGSVRLDDAVVELEPMDAIRVGPQVARGFEAGPDGLEILAFGPRHAGDAEVLQDFWGD